MAAAREEEHALFPFSEDGDRRGSDHGAPRAISRLFRMGADKTFSRQSVRSVKSVICHCYSFFASAAEEGIRANHECAGLQLG